MRHTLRTIAAAAAIALVAAACGDAPDETDEDTSEEMTSEEMTSEEDTAEEESSEEAGGGDLVGCMVTDTGGVDDRSFNETAYEGLVRAEAELGAESRVLESTSDADFQPNINQHVSSGDCSLIVTVGFLLDGATQTAAQENPDQDFAIVDVDFFDFDAGEDVSYDNVEELTFATDQAAFLAGYLAASETETGAVGTYGGINIPTVTIFMDGFLAGVNYYNDENGTDVQVLGWDGENGSFVGNFESQQDGRNLTDGLLQQGADIIMPVAGPVGLGTVAAVEDARADGQDAWVVWVDTDGTVSVPESADVFLTSVLKRIDNAVFAAMETKANDSFEGGLYVGTLENEGVGIVTDNVEGEMSSTLDELRDGIIAGEIAVTPGG